jgi:general secretion pathway protein F
MFWGTLVYPTLILLVLLVVVQVVCRIADESFFGIFQDFGVERTGGMVGLLIAVATFIATYGIWLTLGLILVPVVIWLLMRVLVRPARRRQLFCRIPLVGPIARYSSLTEFCHRLAMLLEAEVPLPLAFKLAGSSVADAGVAEACERMGQAVASGEPLWKAVRLWRSIPAGLGQLFRWSEERRNLPRALHMAGEMFEARARSQSSFARSVLATILFLTIIWWICFAFLVLFMPLLSTFRFLSG